MTVKLVGSSSGSVALAAPASTTGDANIEFKLPVADGSANQLLKTDGSGQLSFTQNLNSPTFTGNLQVARDSYIGTVGSGQTTINIGSSGGSQIGFHKINTNDDELRFYTHTNASSHAERMRIDSSGNVGIGTTAPVEKLGIDGGIRLVTANDETNRITSLPSGGYNLGTTGGAAIAFHRISDGAGGSDEISFETHYQGNSHSERLRILKNGSITTNGNTSLPTGSTSGFGFSTDQFYLSYTGTGANYSQRFYNGNGLVGSILVNGSSTGYNTSSDYRLKENASAISDGITRLKELKPYKFNFKADESKTLDGFFAHEAQAVVPESATGVKDEVDSDNKPIYQGIDQSKLVPLLTAALQEAVAKIETLETKVAALEAK